MAKVDVHVHGILSKAYPFDPEHFLKMVAQARRTGLDGFALTEHFHARHFWDVHEDLLRRYPYEGGVYQTDQGIRVISGAELDVREGGHIGILGHIDDLHALDEAFPLHLNQGYYPAWDELEDEARRHNLTLIANHPARPLKYLFKLTLEQLAKFDALELNGKDDGEQEEAVVAMLERLQKPRVGGSDAHVWAQVGVRHTVYPGQVTLESLRSALAAHQTTVATREHRLLIVRLCAMYKRVTKAHRARGVSKEIEEMLAAGLVEA